jgi:hypothetical protein
MFDLEAQIKQWREVLARKGLNAREVVDELETHLRKDFRVLLSEGETEARAFQLAVSRLGNPGPLQTEFNKLKSAHIWPVKIGAALWLGLVIVQAALLPKGFFNARLTLIEYAHILSVTAGYCAVFLTGGFGAYYVCARQFHRLSPVRQRSLIGASHLFSQLAAGLVIVGVLLGMQVSKQFLGSYWPWNLNQIGALCVIGWLVALVAARRFGRINDHAAMRLCLGGSVIATLAWFGVGTLNRTQPSHDYRWPLTLATLLLINFGFLAMGMLPARKRTA